MTLWRLEWLRLVRTRRLVAILGAYLFFGLTGPLTARYLDRILGGIGTEGVRVQLPAPTPADGIAQFTGNASQIGLLVVVLVAASALAFDARREMAVFLRTRVRGAAAVILPAYLVSAAAAVSALTLGTLAAWYETAVLLGGLPVARLLVGLACGALFLAFAVAVTALAAAITRGVAATAGAALAALLALAVADGLTGVPWLPTRLAGAMETLVRGEPATGLPAGAALTAALTAGALAAAVAVSDRREL
ncbi:unnamed protein product [[Actinomadura] parvosata subsp. kistnae]|uniref:ABC transporter permease n=1 Tax=[Actinomadura] parvosata subsp. kistnae TaxID=1909395 RepID=A0A1U9ZTJ6_9ACTN|nr:hypothetical protein [Nonomuraea sp. ATCC 55076]AQZ61263.1 hypothetical protein BKM31_06980 [Nonomuraea sp. ATCC 55076]SPL97906.1 unnamed protein product [Actinomadura parvosata subsp. kistnae]